MALAWALAALAGGCGYRPLGQGPAFGARALCVLPFAEPDAAGITASLSHHLGLALAAEGFVVVTDPARADAVLTGDIAVRHAAGATLQAVQVYTVDVGVHAALWGAQGTLLWQTHSQLQEDFLPTQPSLHAEPLITERRRQVALARLAERMAEHLVARLRLDASGLAGLGALDDAAGGRL